jgi:hypothetical protein
MEFIVGLLIVAVEARKLDGRARLADNHGGAQRAPRPEPRRDFRLIEEAARVRID